MRKRSIRRPNEKLRGVKRRIKALEGWPDVFCSWFPSDVDLGYWNCKIPVLDRLVSRKASSRKIQTRAANALLRAGENIRKARPSKYSYSIVTVIVTYPEMFDSELCVFFDKQYFNKFFKRNTSEQRLLPTSGDSLSERMELLVPASFSEEGFDFEFINDEGDWERTQWWVYTSVV